MESTADKLRAFALALGVHLLCLAIALLGLWWTRSEAPLSVAGSVIEAELVTAPSSAPARPAPPKPTPVETAPKPQPKPAPKPQQAPEPPQPEPQAPVRQPDTRETERAAALALKQAEEKARREEQERRRQEQVLLDEQKKQEAERRERLRKQQDDLQKKLDEIKRQREEAERRRKLEAEKLKQIEDLKAQQAPTPTPDREAPPADKLGNEGKDDSLAGRYALAIQQAVTNAWLRPENVTSVQCRVRIIQIPGGEVISANVLSPCPADDLTRRSLEAAVLKAQPLPYRGFETVFAREVTLNFCYPRDRCQ